MVDSEGDVFAKSVTASGGTTLSTTTVSTLTVENNATIGDAVTDTLTVNARIASDLLPISDNLYRLGTSTLRWLSLDVNNVVASSTLAVSTTTIPLGYGVNIATSTYVFGSGYFSNALGVGILNTTANTLRVGQCVTGDTRLRRRRKKKSYRGSTSIDDDYIYDEPQIIDIKPGDEVLSLNEKTGHLEWQPILALYDMGEKPVYKITTQSGKTIRTTSNHPYLTKYGWIPVGDLREGNEIALPKEEALAAVGFGLGLNFGDSDMYVKPIKNNAVVADSKSIDFSAFSFYGVREMKWISAVNVVFDLLYDAALCLQRQFAQVAIGMLGKTVAVHFIPSRFSISLADTTPDFREASISFQNFGETYSKLSSNPSKLAANRSNARFGSKIPGATLMLVIGLFIQRHYKRTKEWLSSANNETLWDRIISIDYCGIEKVWDISVKNTHNFIANGIIAHNTAFIVDSSGNVGVGTTTPPSQLSVASSAGSKSPLSVYGYAPTGQTADLFQASVSATATAAFVITSAGQVGIGTTTPGNLLSVHSSGNVYFGGALTVSGNSLFQNATTTGLSVNGGTLLGSLAFGNATGTALTINGGVSFGSLGVTGNSNLGNATTTGLTVSGGTSLGSLSAGAATTTSLGVTGGAQLGALNVLGSANFLNSATTTGLYVSGNLGVASSSPSAVLSVNVSNANGVTPALNITSATSSLLFVRSDGNVGINTTTPTSTLAVLGTLNVQQTTTGISSLYVNSSGNVGIGTTNPTTQNGSVSQMVVLGGANNLVSGGNITGTTIDQGLIIESQFTGQSSGSTRGPLIALLRETTSLTALSTYISFYTTNAGSLTEQMRITSAGTVGIGMTPTRPLSVSGSIGTSGAFFSDGGISSTGQNNTLCYTSPTGLFGTCTSDARLKKNIAYIENGLDILEQFKPATFDFIKGDPDQAGFIAQDLQQILPGAVTAAKDGYLSVNTTHILAYAVKSIQEIASSTISLQNQINALIATSTLTAAKGTFALSTMNSDLNLNGFSILNVKSISGMNGLWKIDEGGNLIVQSVETQKLTVGGGAASGVTVYNRTTGQPKCIYIDDIGDTIKVSTGACGATTNIGTPAVITAVGPIATTTPIIPTLTATTTPTTSTSTLATTEQFLISTTTPVISPASEPVIASTTTATTP